MLRNLKKEIAEMKLGVLILVTDTLKCVAALLDQFLKSMLFVHCLECIFEHACSHFVMENVNPGIEKKQNKKNFFFSKTCVG